MLLSTTNENTMHSEPRNDGAEWQPQERHMRLAIGQAAEASAEGEVPVGAVIVKGTTLIAKAHNQVEKLRDPTAHAEILAITQAAARRRGQTISCRPAPKSPDAHSCCAERFVNMPFGPSATTTKPKAAVLSTTKPVAKGSSVPS